MNINSILKNLREYRESEKSCSQKSIVNSMLVQNEVVSTIELKDRGVMNPLQIIGNLMKKGAVITKERKDTTDSSGRLYRRVSHYSLIGWEE